jgi:hypothetical protein
MKVVLRIATEALPRSRLLQPEGVGADSLHPLSRFNTRSLAPCRCRRLTVTPNDRATNRGRRVRYVLSSEEYTAVELVRRSRAAEAAGFDALWFPITSTRGTTSKAQSPFVWSVSGAVLPGLPTSASHRGDLSDGAHRSGDRRPAGGQGGGLAGRVHPRRRLR